MRLRPKDSAEQYKHLTAIRASLVQKRRTAVLKWAESRDDDAQSKMLAELIGYQQQIDAVDRAMDDES